MHKQQCKGPFRPATALILASASPRRKALLASIGLDFGVVPSDVEEPPPGEKVEPVSYALSNARLKAEDVSRKYPQSVVLGADTIVVLDDIILGKPQDKGHAVSMLTELCGRTHRVFTACHLIIPDSGRGFDLVAESRVRLASLAPSIIKAYVETGECLDKAGSYAVQGIGAFMVEGIEGSYTNVVGLPLSGVVKFLVEKEVLVVS